MKTYYATYKVYLNDNSNYRLSTKYIFADSFKEAEAKLLNVEPSAVNIILYKQS